MGRPHQQLGDAARKHKEPVPIPRYVAPSVYYGTDSMITAESLDSAILFLRELAEVRTCCARPFRLGPRARPAEDREETVRLRRPVRVWGRR